MPLNLYPACPDCEGELPETAPSCRCGWKRPVEGAAPGPGGFARPKCFTEGCSDPAIARVHTKYGWVDLCLDCYGTAEKVPVPTSKSFAAEETRAAYEKSSNYRRNLEGEPVPGSIGEVLANAKRRR